jgi:hypothetical protein
MYGLKPVPFNAKASAASLMPILSRQNLQQGMFNKQKARLLRGRAFALFSSD